MDLEAIWQANRPFILQVMGGAAAFLLLMLARGSIESSAAQQARANASIQAALVDKAAQLEDAEGLEKGRADALSERLEPALTRALLWQPAAEFVLPAGEASPALFYASALSQAVSEVERHAARWNAQVPRGAAGLGLAEQVNDAAVPEALARADLARRLLLELLDAGVRQVSALSAGEARYEPRQGGGFLRVLAARARFAADPAVLEAVLAAFAVEGSFLEVQSCELLRAGGSGPSLSAELTLAALSVVEQPPEGAVTASRSAGEGARGSGGAGGRLRRFGRER